LNSITGNGCTYGDLNAIVGKDQSGVRDSELSGRHFVDGVVLTGLGVLKRVGDEKEEERRTPMIDTRTGQTRRVWEKALA
jgi:hypothetical protein